MMDSNFSCAILIIYLGRLPDYFHYWAKTCGPNHPSFHWFVYTDQIDEKQIINEAVTLVPYRFEALCSDASRMLGIHLDPQNTRMVCDCRILLYGMRRHEEALKEYDFIGYSDLDVLYGQILRYLPENASRYAMISAHDNRPCGPFTLMNRNCIEAVIQSERIKKFFESAQADVISAGKAATDAQSRFMPISGNSKKDKIADSINFCHLDESDLLVELAASHGPVFCRAEPLQPAMTPKINHRKAFALWDNGRLYVRDILGRQKEGAVFHFSRFKNRTRFKVTDIALNSRKLGVYKYGIIDAGSWLTRQKMYLTLLY